MTAALQAGNVSEAWRMWSLSAEVSLVRTFFMLEVQHGLVVSRLVGVLQLFVRSPSVVRALLWFGLLVVFWCICTQTGLTAGLVKLKRQIQGVFDLLDAIDRHGITLSRSLELGRRWESGVRVVLLAQLDGLTCSLPLRLVCWSSVRGFGTCIPGWGLSCMQWLSIGEMLLSMAGALGYWRISWSTLTGGCVQIVCPLPPFSSVILDPLQMLAVFFLILISLIMSSVRLGFSSSAGETGGLRTFLPLLLKLVAGCLSCLLLIFLLLLALTFMRWFKRRSLQLVALEGWGWRELKTLPVAWYDSLAVFLDRVEIDGNWPDGLLDAYNIVFIPKADGDATPLGQRPLCVLLVCIDSGPRLGWVTLLNGSNLGFLSVFSALVVVVARLKPGTPLH